MNCRLYLSGRSASNLSTSSNIPTGKRHLEGIRLVSTHPVVLGDGKMEEVAHCVYIILYTNNTNIDENQQ